MKKLTCQCGGVEIQVKLPDDLGKLMRCNCSMCKRKSATMSMIAKDDLKILKGEDLLNIYQYQYECDRFRGSICTQHSLLQSTPEASPLRSAVRTAWLQPTSS